MTDIEPQHWRGFTELRPEHVQMLEYLEAEWLRADMPPDQLRANLLRQARDFRAYELGDPRAARHPASYRGGPLVPMAIRGWEMDT
jgi:hypothetical protein